MVGSGVADGRRVWLSEQAAHDLEVIRGRYGTPAGDTDLFERLRKVAGATPLTVRWDVPEPVVVPAVDAAMLSHGVREAPAVRRTVAGPDRARPVPASPDRVVLRVQARAARAPRARGSPGRRTTRTTAATAAAPATAAATTPAPTTAARTAAAAPTTATPTMATLALVLAAPASSQQRTPKGVRRAKPMRQTSSPVPYGPQQRPRYPFPANRF
jgi:hypothetical protein